MTTKPQMTCNYKGYTLLYVRTYDERDFVCQGDCLDILEMVQQSNREIGIISHIVHRGPYHDLYEGRFSLN